MTKGKIIAASVVVALVAAIGGGYAFSRATAKTTITTATVTKQTLRVAVTAPGTVEAPRPAAVYAPVAGTLASVAVADGQRVTAGQPLATLDARPLTLAVRQAEAQRSAARALPTGTQRLNAARRDAIEAADAALAAARASAAATVLRAPTAGVVTFDTLAITRLDGTGPTAAKGASVAPSVPVFTVVNPATLAFTAQVDEADIAGIAPGQATAVTLDAYPGRSFAGTVTGIRQSAVTTSTGGIAFGVRASLAAKGARLFAGMTGDVDIAVRQVKDAVTVPLQAILTEGTTRSVFRVRDGRVTKVPVTVGAVTDRAAQVSGVSPGNTVATGTLTALADGMAVDATR